MAKLPDIQSMGARPTPTLRGSSQFSTPQTADLGAGISALGEAFSKMEYQDDQVMAEDAYNQLQQKKIDLTNGENGFQSIQSSGVVTRPVYKEYTSQFDDEVEVISGKLNNDRQREFFRRRADVSKLQYGSDLTNHIQREKNVHADQVFKGGKAVELQNAASHWQEPGSVALSIERSKRLIDQQAERDGWAPAAKKAQSLMVQSEIHETVISQAIATDNPAYAEAWFGKNKKNIDATQHPRIESLIREGGIKVLAQKVTDDIEIRGLDEKSALAEVRKKYKGDEENAIIRSVRDRFNESDKIQDDNERTNGEKAWSIFAETGDFNQIPVTTLQGMKGKERESLRAYSDKQNSGTPVKTNYKVYQELLQMNRDDPKMFKDTIDNNFHTLIPYLSETHRNQLLKASTEKTEIDYISTQAQLSKRWATKAGLDIKAAGKDNDDGKALSSFYESLDSQVANFQTSKGRKPDDKELTEIMDKMVMDKVFVDEWFGDPEKPVSTLTEEEIKKAYVEIEGKEVILTDIPPEDRVTIIQKRTKLGLPVTEEAIARSWLIMNGRL